MGIKTCLHLAHPLLALPSSLRGPILWAKSPGVSSCAFCFRVSAGAALASGGAARVHDVKGRVGLRKEK